MKNDLKIAGSVVKNKMASSVSGRLQWEYCSLSL
jgi:hypothetical protein